MGRKVSISQPAVIQTELRPLDESFWIDANGQLEQWYYQNTGAFSPDRQVTPLKLTPHLSAIDPDGNNGQGTTYTPTLALTKWEVKEFIDGAWVTRNITSLSPSDAYSIDTDGLTLIVAKNNYDAAHAINLTCNATYIDPRDEGVTYTVSESTMLLTSVDATQVFPNIDIKNPSSRMFNPLKDNPIYEFEGSADWDVLEGQGDTVVTEYKADALGTEKIIPANEDMLVNAAPLLDIKYGDMELSQQQFMERQVSGGVVSEIGDGVAKITNIKGNTVKWNQITQNGDFSNGTTNWTIEGTASVSNNVCTYTCNRSAGFFYQEVSLISGHKYYQSVELKKTTASANIMTFFIASGSDTGVSTAETTNWQAVTRIATANATILGKTVVSDRRSSGWDSVQIRNFMLFDLTDMFGSGNEPTTVEQFEQWLSQNIGLKSYYPYTAGELVNYGGYAVKWNQLFSLSSPSIYKSNGSVAVGIDNDFTLTISTAYYPYGLANLDSSHKYIIKGTMINKYGTGHIGLFQDGTAKSWITSSVNSDTWYSTASYNGTFNNIALTNNTNNGVAEFKNFMIIDLTIMFGAGNEPDLDWCNKYLSRDYYDYCPSVDKNILDVAEVKTAGFNKFDGEFKSGYYNTSNGTFVSSGQWKCSANMISVIPNTTYYNYKDGNNFVALYYGKDGSYLNQYSDVGTNTEFTVPNNCYYILFYASSNTNYTCINISDSSRNGTYEPYHAQYEKLPMGVKSVGFNLWDEEWEVGGLNTNTGGNLNLTDRIRSKNFMPCLPDVTYYAQMPTTMYLLWYDSNKNFIRFNAPEHISVSPSNAAYFKFSMTSNYGTTYNHDICINISDASRNGTYEPHWESFSDMSWITKIGIENFNIWDEEWELGNFDDNGQPVAANNVIRSKNFTPVIGGKKYMFNKLTPVGHTIVEYRANKSFIKYSYISTATNNSITVSSDCAYVKFAISASSYTNDVCFNLYNEHFNGRYYPYGATAPYFPQGLCNVGSVYDEVKVENGKIKGVVRFGCEDMGNLDYTYSSESGGFFISNSLTSRAYSSSVQEICSNYVNVGDKTVAQMDSVGSMSFAPNNNNIVIKFKNTSYADASAFKDAMKGVKMVYALATPYEFEIDYPTKGQFEWYGIDGGGNEVPIDTLPVYSQAEQPSGYGQHTSKININALYGESIPVILRVKRYPWSTNVLPPKVTKAVSWKLPPVDVQVVSDKGSAVRAQNQSGNFTFSTIVNQQGDIIGEEVKRANMVFDWYYKNGNGRTSQPVSGQTFTVSAATLKNTRPQAGATPSTRVWCEAFVLGAYHLVNGTYVRTKD